MGQKIDCYRSTADLRSVFHLSFALNFVRCVQLDRIAWPRRRRRSTRRKKLTTTQPKQKRREKKYDMKYCVESIFIRFAGFFVVCTKIRIVNCVAVTIVNRRLPFHQQIYGYIFFFFFFGMKYNDLY